VGSTATQPVAFTLINPFLSVTGEGFGVDGGTSSEFSDAGGDTCSLPISSPAALCVFNVKFAPAQSGARRGSLQFTGATGQFVGATGSVVSYFPGGDGVAANTSVDPASTITLESGITPNGLAADANGNVYIADTGGSKVLKVASSGGAATTLMTGLSKPA